MIHFLVPAEQEAGIKDYLDVHGASFHEDLRIVHYDTLVQQKQFHRGTYVCSSLDQLNTGMTEFLAVLHQKLMPIAGFRFLNIPKVTLRRFDLLKEFHRLGLNEFAVERASGDLQGLTFPVFIRNEKLHEGALSELLNSEREVRQAIGKALVQGHNLKHLIVVEFCDTANEAGYYRKYASFVVGKRIIPRSLNYGRSWMLKHAGTEFTMPMVLEELEYVTSNLHQEQLAKIFELAGVEYGRIDYAIKDGAVQTWEINLNPTIGRGNRPRSMNISADLDVIREKVRQNFYEGFESAWREVDLKSEHTMPVAVEIDSQILAAACEKPNHESRLLNSMRTILRPAKPIIEPLSPPFLGALSWLARHRSK